jgi:hypothetical protein
VDGVNNIDTPTINLLEGIPKYRTIANTDVHLSRTNFATQAFAIFSVQAEHLIPMIYLKSVILASTSDNITMGLQYECPMYKECQHLIIISIIV